MVNYGIELFEFSVNKDIMHTRIHSKNLYKSMDIIISDLLILADYL